MIATLRDADWETGINQIKMAEPARKLLRQSVLAFLYKSQAPTASQAQAREVLDVIFFVRFEPSGRGCIIEHKKGRLQLAQENCD